MEKLVPATDADGIPARVGTLSFAILARKLGPKEIRVNALSP
jgi:hypothetical protein